MAASIECREAADKPSPPQECEESTKDLLRMPYGYPTDILRTPSGAEREQSPTNTHATSKLVRAFRLSGRGDDASAGCAGSLPGSALRNGGKSLFRKRNQRLQNGQAGPGGVAGEFAQ